MQSEKYLHEKYPAEMQHMKKVLKKVEDLWLHNFPYVAIVRDKKILYLPQHHVGSAATQKELIFELKNSNNFQASSSFFFFFYL